MVQKAVQQLLFDVDWSASPGRSEPGPELDVLVVDMPPGTGDVPLTLGQLVVVDGALGLLYRYRVLADASQAASLSQRLRMLHYPTSERELRC